MLKYLFIHGDSPVIMSPTELKMQPTIHLERKAGYLPRQNTDLRFKCIVGCIFNSVGLVITRESPCILTDMIDAVYCIHFVIMQNMKRSF
jgi:hypothetical protein